MLVIINTYIIFRILVFYNNMQENIYIWSSDRLLFQINYHIQL